MSRDRRQKLQFSTPFARGMSIFGLCVALGIVAFATFGGTGVSSGDTDGPQLFLARGQ